MKQFLIILAVVSGIWSVHAADPTTSQFAQIYFAGTTKISADPESAAFRGTFNCVEARALEAQTLDKLARFPRAFLKDEMSASAMDGSDLLRPLLDDLLASEWHLTLGNSGRRVPEFTLAVRLPASRDVVWEKNLATVLQSWTGIAVHKTADGWVLQKHEPPVIVRFARTAGLVIFSATDNQPFPGWQMLQDKRPKPWLLVDADGEQLARLAPALKLSDMPMIHLELAGHGGNLEWKGRADFAGAAPVLIEPWQLPTDSIQSFISFTAARGFAPWLQRQAWYQPYRINPVPNQLCNWAMPQIPFQTYLTVPTADPGQALTQIYNWMNPAIMANNAARKSLMPFTLKESKDNLTIGGAPYISPYIQALHDRAGQFLQAGVFPLVAHKASLPQPLIAQLKSPNLVYYHWEITSDRASEILNLSQLALVLTRHRQLDGNSAAFKWLTKIEPKLGATTTAVYLSGPNQLVGIRTAPAGLTALELFGLAYWLDAPNFPGCEMELPGPKHRKMNRMRPLMSAPGNNSTAPATH